MNQFDLINETEENIPEFEELRPFLEYALKKQKLENVLFNVILVNDEMIHQINKMYREVDRATDVISFALEDNEEGPDIGFRILGDIYISIDHARNQALEYEHSFKRELSFLTIHGLLHLLGYDHMKKDDEKKMFELQKEILDSYGIIR